MAAGRKTFYEVLGVKPGAKAHDIGRAYARIRSDMQKEHTAPDARFAAMAKVAYETLSDPDKRAEYDESLGIVQSSPARRRKLLVWGGGAVAVAGIAAVVGGYLMQRPAHTASGERIPTVAELVQDVGNRVGRVRGALMSGEVRDLGLAVETGEGEMAFPCRGIPAGMVLTVQEGATPMRAELSRAQEDLGICLIAVKGVREGVKVRPGVPAVQEALQAIVPGADGAPQAIRVHVARTLQDPKGQAFALNAATTLPNGTPVFDAQARLVGLVVTPHDFGAGLTAALGVARIVQARTGGALAASEPAVAAANVPAPVPAPASRPAPAASRAKLVGEGFTTLWKEDEVDGSLVEVLDDVKKGYVGLPIAYWTKWSGRDGQVHATHCTVLGPGGVTVSDYDQIPAEADPEGYWFCAITRFQADLDDLPVGEYTFTQFVDGRQVAENSARLERRIVTPGRLIILVLVAGGGLLLFLRRNREIVDEVDR